MQDEIAIKKIAKPVLVKKKTQNIVALVYSRSENKPNLAKKSFMRNTTMSLLCIVAHKQKHSRWAICP